jgi:NitT/TauT family transport system substrate-binding protein
VISAADRVRAVVGQRGTWDTSLVELGINKGIFKKHGLAAEISYSAGSGETIQAVLSGSAEFAIGAGGLGAIGAFQRGAPLRIIGAEITGSPNYWLVKKSSPIKSIKDIDGKRVAISTVGSGTHAVVLTASRDHGVSPKIVPTGNVAATFTALMSDQVDVAFAVPPTGLDYIDRGELRMLFRDNDIESIRNQSSRVLVTRPDVDDDIVRRFLAAYEETARWMYADDEEALRAFAKLVNMDVKTARRVRDEFYSLDAILPGSLKGLDIIIKDAVTSGYLSKALTDDELKVLTERIKK